MHLTDDCGATRPGLGPGVGARIPENGGAARNRGVSDVISLPMPRWLVPWSCPLIEEIVCDLGCEHQRLYVKHLAEAVHRGEDEPPSLPWLAVDRASAEIVRHRRGEEAPARHAAGGVA